MWDCGIWNIDNCLLNTGKGRADLLITMGSIGNLLIEAANRKLDLNKRRSITKLLSGWCAMAKQCISEDNIMIPIAPCVDKPRKIGDTFFDVRSKDERESLWTDVLGRVQITVSALSTRDLYNRWSFIWHVSIWNWQLHPDARWGSKEIGGRLDVFRTK